MAAQVLRHQVDSLNDLYSDPAIIIMGDFNDTPFDESVMVTLGAVTPDGHYTDESLVNLVANFQKDNVGSYNYKGNWQALDQLIVSESILTDDAAFRVDDRKVRFIATTFRCTTAISMAIRPIAPMVVTTTTAVTATTCRPILNLYCGRIQPYHNWFLPQRRHVQKQPCSGNKGTVPPPAVRG